MRCRSVLALLCGMSVLTISSCTENPAASHPSHTAVSTATVTATPTSSPEPTSPIMETAAKAKTKAGLEAFARHWLDARSYMVATGNTGVFLSLSTSACEWCRDLAKIYDGVYRAGGSYSGDLDAQVTQILLTGLSGGHAGYVEFRAEIPAHIKIPAKGASPESKQPAVLDYTLNLDYLNGQWKVRRASWNTVREG
jgi:hypothetical protein